MNANTRALYMSDRFIPLIQEVEFLIAEAVQLEDVGPCFTILHRNWMPGTVCCPGEQVALVELNHRADGIPLSLPLAERLQFDYLGRYRLPQSAAQIEAGMRTDAFCVNHARNAGISSRQTRKFARSEIRVYIQRIRKALEDAFKEAGIKLDPADVLVSERTTGNEVSYRLKGSVEWIHSRW